MDSQIPSGMARKFRFTLALGLVAIAIATVAIGLMRERSRAEEAASEPVPDATQDDGVIRVYYFHGDVRCKTCLAIEARTSEIVSRVFADEIASGWLRFERVNYDEPANRHFREEYRLAFSTVVVQGAGEDRKWENLAEVWTLIHQDEPALEEYLTRHILRMIDPTG